MIKCPKCGKKCQSYEHIDKHNMCVMCYRTRHLKPKTEQDYIKEFVEEHFERFEYGDMKNIICSLKTGVGILYEEDENQFYLVNTLESVDGSKILFELVKLMVKELKIDV